MRPGSERGNARGAGEWENLLEILRTADSPVGAAIHWVESHGGDGSNEGGGKRRKTCELWRFVPELLASEVVYVEAQDEDEEEKEATDRKGGRVGNCIWMQTLPSAMQTNILTFLNVEHRRFRTKDLEQLARCILCSQEPEFWLIRAGENLLQTSLGGHIGMTLPSASKDKRILAEMEEYDALPDWLDRYTEHRNSSFSWLPLGQLSLSKEADQRQEDNNVHQQESPECSMENPKSEVQLDELGIFHTVLEENAHTTGYEGSGAHVSKSATQVPPTEMLKLQSDKVEANNGQIKEGVHLNIDAMEMNDDDGQNLITKEEMTARADLGDEVFSQALSLRLTLHSCQASELPEKVVLIRSAPKLSIFLSVVRAWEVDDEVTLLLAESLLTEQDGYAWSTQILQSLFLPKLLELEKPVSRLLITALAQAGKTHPRATMDAVVFPLICSEKGASNIHCEVINRIVKDCLPDNVNLSLCERMFATWEEKVYGSRAKASWVWTEGMITVVQNLLSYKLDLDDRTISCLICALDGVVEDFSTSLKFGNLLLHFLSKYGPKLKSHKSLLHLVAGRSRTFLTKSLLTKLSAL